MPKSPWTKHSQADLLHLRREIETGRKQLSVKEAMALVDAVIELKHALAVCDRERRAMQTGRLF